MQEATPQKLTQVLRTTQIIAGGMIGGVLVFGLIAAMIGADGDPGDPLVGVIALVFAVSGLGARILVPGLIAAKKREEIQAQLSAGEIDESEEMTAVLYPLYQTKTIIEYALIEGPAFFVLIAYIITSQLWVLAIGAVLLAIMIVTFPTQGRLEGWIRNQLQLMEQNQS